DLSANQVGCQLWQPIHLILGPAVFDRHVLALNIADILQALAKSAQTLGESVRRRVIEEPDHRHRRLLRACREGPRGRRPAERSYHFPPSDSNRHVALPCEGWLEPISKSPEEDNEASELYEAEEVVGVVFPTDEDAALPLNPSKEALHEPTSHIAV